ncbi:sensor domain-containing phosphodiesterase [Rhodococcus aerolatus]
MYQPVVALGTGEVVGYEALARGPGGALGAADAVLAAARAQGVLAEVDWACRAAAVRGAVAARLPAGMVLFVNAEPEVLTSPPPPGVRAAAAGLSLVMEVTERGLTLDPAGVLRGCAAARAWGMRIALDDVGADRASLALLPLLRPDVIKLDLRLVQASDGADVDEIATAVNAEAERTGAVVLAEGIETEAHRELGSVLGATLGQGWLFGRPGPLPPFPGPGNRVDAESPGRGWIPGVGPVPGQTPTGESLFSLVAGHPGVRRGTKARLVEVSRLLERRAGTEGASVVVLGAFQHARQFSAESARRYAGLSAGAAFVGAFAVGMAPDPAGETRGVALGAADPVAGEWAVVVLGPHFAAALLTRDLGDTGPDHGRRFDYLVTYDRDTVATAARLLMHRVRAATVPGGGGVGVAQVGGDGPPPSAGVGGQ